jgi:hypothetical protein
MQSWPSCPAKAICRSVQVDNNGKALSQRCATGATISTGFAPFSVKKRRKRLLNLANLAVFNVILLSHGAVDEELNGLTAIRTHAVDRFHTKPRHTLPLRYNTLNAVNKATPLLRDIDGIGRS